MTRTVIPSPSIQIPDRLRNDGWWLVSRNHCPPRPSGTGKFVAAGNGLKETTTGNGLKETIANDINR